MSVTHFPAIPERHDPAHQWLRTLIGEVVGEVAMAGKRLPPNGTLGSSTPVAVVAVLQPTRRWLAQAGQGGPGLPCALGRGEAFPGS